MIKILKELQQFLNLRPNCLLTRKPVLVVSPTRMASLTWLKRRLYLWQIRRHGYPISWPVPQTLLKNRDPKFHYLNIEEIINEKSQKDKSQKDNAKKDYQVSKMMETVGIPTQAYHDLFPQSESEKSSMDDTRNNNRITVTQLFKKVLTY